ncbi:MAG: LPS-assembly protein LptD [Cellvibrionaceae bacterium]
MRKLTVLSTAITCMLAGVSTASQAENTVEDIAYKQLSKVLDWVPLKALNESQRQALPPGSCGAYIAPMRNDAEAKLQPQEAPIRASADRSTVSQINDQSDSNQVVLVGDVVVTQGYRQAQAQQAQLDQTTGTLVMQGELELREPGLLVLGDATVIEQQQDTLSVDNATYVLHKQSIRGQAKKITKTPDNTLNLDQASFTQCEPENNTWVLKGSQIILDTDARQGHAKHVRLVVKGVPVFYFPYLRFPLGSERLSGFLAPSFSFSRDGNDASVPYYFNLAPNYDLLFTTHIIRQHGLLYEGNFRHLSRAFYTRFNTSYLKDDKGKIDESDRSLINRGLITEEQAVPFKDQDRWMINLNQTGGQGRRWSTTIDYTKVSDIDYFRDFETSSFDGSAIGDDDDTNLDQKILTSYALNNWSIGLDLIRYQTLSESLTLPYEQLPAISFDGNYRFGKTSWSDWSLELGHEWIQFDHPDADDASPILTGNRLRTDYSFGWNAEPEWGFFKPTIQLKHLQYELDDNNFVADADTSPSLTVPQATIDSGLYFERDGNGYLQTFEPRLFYFYSDFEDHSRLFDLTTDNQDIDFDTSELTFSYSQLFRDTRFSGGDRIDDANQLAIGLTTRFFGNKSGREWFSASVGQIKYFDDRRVTLNNTAQTEGDSAIAAQIASRPSDDWRIGSDLLYDDTLNKLSRGNLKFEYQNDKKHLFNLNYRFVRGTTEDNFTKQVDSSIITPLFSDRWHLLLYGAYDLERSRELETLSAIEYRGCCYRIRAGYRVELDNDLADTIPDSELEYEYSTFLEFHFIGLGGTGKQLDSILDENIDGYAEWQAIYHQ